MKREIHDLNDVFRAYWLSVQNSLPEVVMAIVVLVIGLFLLRQLNRIALRMISKHSHDEMITEFLVTIITFVMTIVLMLICFNIIGWGSFTNKILAGAGLSAFIVGFALKDIGENFLAGIIMAFNRPFRMGDMIEVEKVKGTVMRMSLRETYVKTLDGKDVFVPNGYILRNPLQNYTLDGRLRSEFLINVDYKDDIESAIEIIQQIVRQTVGVDASPAGMAIVDEFTESTVKLKVLFWFRTDNPLISGMRLKSDIMIKVVQTLLAEGFHLTADVYDVNLRTPAGVHLSAEK
jgi:small conductance mechanosensitive channel